MFLTEVLERCRKFEQRLADIYSQFAERLKEDKEIESFWLGMALMNFGFRQHSCRMFNDDVGIGGLQGSWHAA